LPEARLDPYILRMARPSLMLRVAAGLLLLACAVFFLLGPAPGGRGMDILFVVLCLGLVLILDAPLLTPFGPAPVKARRTRSSARSPPR
jgi:hypothetical protein